MDKRKQKKRKALVVIYWEHPQTQELLILLLRRPDSDGGYWQPVTGGVESGEDFTEGALREAEEESGFSFSEKVRSIGLHYEFEGRWGPAEEMAFSLQVHSEANGSPADKPPTPTIDPKEHCDFQWADPMTAHKLVKFPRNKEAIFRTAFRPTPISIDAEGRLLQDGEAITHERTKELLYQSIERNDGRFDYIDSEFVIHVEGHAIPLIPDDTPLHVKSVDTDSELIMLMSGEELPLEPSTIEIGDENVMYCMIKGMRARFLRPAYYKLADRIEERPSVDGSGSEYFLQWGGRDYPIRISS